METKKVVVTGKYTSRTGLWKITAARDGRKATAQGRKMSKVHRAAVAALALIERMSTESGEIELSDLPVVPEDRPS